MGNTCSTGNSYEALTYRPAIILYPALLTPAIVTGDQDLEILLLGKKGEEITEVHVANQLKVDTTLHRRKRYQLDSLKPDWIKTLEETEIQNEIHETPNRFKGLLHTGVKEEFDEAGYTKLYQVQLSQEVLAGGIDGTHSLFNLLWVHYQKPEVRPSEEENEGFHMPDETRSQQLNGTAEVGEEMAILAAEEQDIILRRVLKEMQDWQPPEDSYGKFGFYADGKPEDINYQEPIQTYHPVFYIKDLEAANIGHIADLHLCGRQHAMAQSPARVIEYEEETNGERAPQDTDVSPEIGPQINVNLDRFNELLEQIGTDEDIDVLLIGGDLADYIKSFYPGDTDEEADSVRDVWEQVGLEDGSNEHYKDFVDFISFFTLIVEFCRDHEKPVFVVSGNHDGYKEPYGIAPWVDISGETRRANPGIPADHNLTLYEAILTFGDTYAEQGPDYNFEAEKLRWFFTVLTPFSDFASYLPQQCLVGMEWGDTQDLLWSEEEYTPSDPREQGFGHLPRTDNVIFDRQLTLFEEVQKNKGGRDVVLMSHFTFVSYASSIPMDPPDKEEPVEGDIEFDSMWDPGDYDMGTFETNRQPLYETYLAKSSDVKLILTGHSHRRGLYTIRETDYEYDNSVVTGFYELSNDGLEERRKYLRDNYKSKEQKKKKDPKIILSDSAGPMPRYNKCGELDEWGSTRPGGTKVTFYSKDEVDDEEDREQGDIKDIELLETTVRPRFVVAVDYLDLIKEKTVLQKFEARVRKEEERTLESYEFDVKVHEEIRELASIQDIILYARNEFGDWFKVKFVPVQSQEGEEKLELQDPKTFRRYFLNHRNSSKSFLAIQFGMNPDYSDRLSQYDFGSYWCFPVDVVKDQNRWKPWEQKHYRIERKDDDLEDTFEMAGPAEIPDFEWRKKLYPKSCMVPTED